MVQRAFFYKMIRGIEKLSRAELFKHVNGGRTRQDADVLNLKQSQARLDVRKNFCTQRIIKDWNSIPSEAKNASNVTGFKAAVPAPPHYFYVTF
jgi:hypothetical protein